MLSIVYCCRCHIIFCAKYGRKVLREEIAERFKKIVISTQAGDVFEGRLLYILSSQVIQDIYTKK